MAGDLIDVLFVCKFNVGRSQMAKAFFNRFAKRSHASSAGVNPYYLHVRLHPSSVLTRVMGEAHFDFTRNRSRMVNREIVDRADLVVALMSRRRASKDLPKYVRNSPKFRLWVMEDVKGSRSREFQYANHVKKRELIKKKVEKLLKEIE